MCSNATDMSQCDLPESQAAIGSGLWRGEQLLRSEKSGPNDRRSALVPRES